MTLTIAIEGTGVLSTAESTTNWGVSGSGGASISLNTETFIQGANSVASKIASGKFAWIYYDYGSAVGALDFTDSSGANFGEYVYIWYNTTTPGFIDTWLNSGMSIRLGTDANNYREWVIHSSDDLNGYTGGWQCAVIDPNSAGSSDTGSYTISTVNWLGVFYSGTGTSVAQNVFVDTIAVGKGLRITDTDVTGWQEVADYCNASPVTRKWGMMQERLGIYYFFGTIFLGDSTQTAITTMSDSNRVFRFGDFEYFTAATTKASSLSDGFNGFILNDDTVYKTDWVETGSLFIGSLLANTTFDIYGGNIATSITTLIGVTFTGIDGGFIWGNDNDHSATNCIWNNCTQINLVGAPVIRGCTFQNHAEENGALLWNDNIDIADSFFTDNNGGTNSAGIEHALSTITATYDNLQFSGNDWDAYLSHATISLTVSLVNLANASTEYSPNAGDITYSNDKTITFTVVTKANGTPISGARVGLYLALDNSEVINDITNGSGVVTTTRNYGSDENMYWRVREVDFAGDDYKHESGNITFGENGINRDVEMTVNQNINI